MNLDFHIFVMHGKVVCGRSVVQLAVLHVEMDVAQF